MTINQTDDEGATARNEPQTQTSRMIWQRESSNFLCVTPEPEKEDFQHEMITSDKKHNFPKPVSFVVKDCQNGEGFNIGCQQISSDLETDLLTVETQLAKADLRRQTPQKISLLEMSQNSPNTLRAVSHKSKNKENESEYAGTAHSKVEIDSHETSKHYLISDIQQTPSVHGESRRDHNETEFDVPDDDIDLGMLDEV